MEGWWQRKGRHSVCWNINVKSCRRDRAWPTRSDVNLSGHLLSRGHGNECSDQAGKHGYRLAILGALLSLVSVWIGLVVGGYRSLFWTSERFVQIFVSTSSFDTVNDGWINTTARWRLVTETNGKGSKIKIYFTWLFIPHLPTQYETWCALFIKFPQCLFKMNYYPILHMRKVMLHRKNLVKSHIAFEVELVF